MAVDSQDHVWVLQRPRSLSEDEKGATLNPPRNKCCAPAPSVMEFDADGTFIQGWGNIYTGEVDNGKRVQKFKPTSGAPKL